MRRSVLAATLLSATFAFGCKGDSKPKPSAGSASPAGSATAGSATAGSATAGSSTAGSATAGSATAGSATAGSATAGSAAAGSAAGSAAPAAPKDDGLAEAGSGSDGRSLYYARALTAADLEGRTLRDLALMRNTVYARAGHKFRKAWLRDHFTAMPWYTPRDADDNSKITAVDRANVKLVAEREVGFSKDQLTAARDAITAKASPSATEQVELRLLNEQLGGTGGSKPSAAKVSPLEDPSQLDRLLTLDELADLSQRDLRILRNTVYARHGRTFKSDTLIEWFSSKDWYKEDPSFSEDKLSAIDRKNVKLIRSVEDSLGGPMTEHQQKVEEGWFDGA